MFSTCFSCFLQRSFYGDWFCLALLFCSSDFYKCSDLLCRSVFIGSSLLRESFRYNPFFAFIDVNMSLSINGFFSFITLNERFLYEA